jgi:Domain of unknown function (DUF4290)
MSKLDIWYNTGKEDIRYPEYGRSIQEMLLHACTIEDDRKRQKTAEAIVGMMQLLNPNKGNIEDYREKLWNHAFAISKYKLNVTPPYGIVIREEDERVQPVTMSYPDSSTRLRHYGNNVHKLIKKAIDMPEGPKREGFVEVIASYMKLAYKNWNREHYVSDDLVKDDLEILSNGQLELHEGHSSLDFLSIGATRREKEIQRMQQRNRTNNNNNRNNNKQQKQRQNQGYRKRKK